MVSMDWRYEDHPLGLRLLVPRVPDDSDDVETARARLGRPVTEPCEYSEGHYWDRARHRPRWWREVVPNGCLCEIGCAGMAAFITDQGFICDPHLAWLNVHTRAKAYVLASARDGRWFPAEYLSPLQAT